MKSKQDKKTRPHVIMSAAMSLDGRIGLPGERVRLSDEEDKLRVHEMRSGVDAIMVGIKTVLSDDPKLTAHHSESGKNPVRVIVDSMARIPDEAKAINDAAKTILAVSQHAPEQKVKRLGKKTNVEVLVIGEQKVNLVLLLDKLYSKYGIRTLMLEGGGTLNHGMLSLGLVDEVYLTLAPTFIGEKGISLIKGGLSGSIGLELEGIKQLGDQVVFHYIINRREE